jgi:hypothetical protein
MIHDLESLWWIAVWFLFRTHPTGTPYNPEIDKIASSIFTRSPYGKIRAARDDMLRSLDGWSDSISALPAEFSALARDLTAFRYHYINMATRTNSSLASEGIAYKISTEHLDEDEKHLDAYDLVKHFFHSETLPLTLITPPKRKDAPDTEHTEPTKASGSKRTRRQ